MGQRVPRVDAVRREVGGRVAESGKFWWCLKHKRVETDENRCKAADRLGPYDTAADAERALQTVAARNEAWDAEDRRWKD